MRGLPVIDVSPLVSGAGDRSAVAKELTAACRDAGFFYVVGHGVPEGLQRRLAEESRAFFALSEAEKGEIAMARGGRAWRGWFPLGGELTSGRPDRKEGLYFGRELPASDPRVAAGRPLHGPNLFPRRPAGLREAVLAYMAALSALGHRLCAGLSLSLGLPESYFAERYTGDPLTLFRVFRYPPGSAAEDWGVGEHTDYGLLTILLQDDAGGLEVRTARGWVAAPPIPGSFVCNIGDMLDRMTGGAYRSTPHRVRNPAPRDRYSFPFFFDPSWDAHIESLVPAAQIADDRGERWDGASVHAFAGCYGDYVLAKVGKVFPDLGREVLRR
jgi:isopenicillin N synthase-like dioxygenase